MVFRLRDDFNMFSFMDGYLMWVKNPHFKSICRGADYNNILRTAQKLHAKADYEAKMDPLRLKLIKGASSESLKAEILSIPALKKQADEAINEFNSSEKFLPADSILTEEEFVYMVNQVEFFLRDGLPRYPARMRRHEVYELVFAADVPPALYHTWDL